MWNNTCILWSWAYISQRGFSLCTKDGHEDCHRENSRKHTKWQLPGTWIDKLRSSCSLGYLTTVIRNEPCDLRHWPRSQKVAKDAAVLILLKIRLNPTRIFGKGIQMWTACLKKGGKWCPQHSRKWFPSGAWIPGEGGSPVAESVQSDSCATGNVGAFYLLCCTIYIFLCFFACIKYNRIYEGKE